MSNPNIAMSPNDLFRQAAAFHQAGRLSEAEALYREVLRVQPGHFDALHLLGVLHGQAGDHKGAVLLIGEALRINAAVPTAHNNRGNALKELGELEEALAAYDRAIALKPDYAEAYNNRAIILHELARAGEALASFDKAVQLKPDYAKAYYNRGNLLRDLWRSQEALASYDRALAFKPDYAEAIYARGLVLQQLSQLDEVLAAYDEAIALKPDYPEAHAERGIVLLLLKRPEDALQSFNRAIAYKPDYAEAFFNRGNALRALERFEEALASYDRAITLRPDYVEAISNRAIALENLGRLDEALESADEAAMLRPDSAEVAVNRGMLLQRLKRWNEALTSFDKAVALKPDSPEAHNNRGFVLQEFHLLEQAVEAYTKAIELKPDYDNAYNNRGNAYLHLKKYAEALADYEKVLQLKPDNADAWGNRGLALSLLKRLPEALECLDKCVALAPSAGWAASHALGAAGQLCDWRGREARISDFTARARAGESVLAFMMLFVADDPEIQYRAALNTAKTYEVTPAPYWKAARAKEHARLRIGYLSSDFKNHPVAQLTAEMFELHDKSRFEIFAVSLAPSDGGALRRRIENAVDHFIEIHNKSDDDAAQILAAAEIDILVDLNGWTQDCRPEIFARRPAPVAANWLGYAGTMGAPFYDYVIADPYVITEAAKPFFSEKVVALPDSYMVQDSTRRVGEKPTRAQAGLPEQGFVFCAFNNNYKITPEIFAVWMRLLKTVEGSVLWLNIRGEDTLSNLRASAKEHGVDPARLLVAGFESSQTAHLGRLALADLFLDTAPYNAHATAGDALWAGVPVLTCSGKAFPARVAGSLLRALGLPELIVSNFQDYEAMALKLAQDSAALQALRDRLERNRSTAPLFDTKRFCRNIEKAYETMWARHRDGLPPEAFSV